MDIPGIGQVIADSIVAFFSNEKMQSAVDHLLSEVTLVAEQSADETSPLAQKTFVITGSLNHFENRNALKALIESKGGKVAGSVSSKTHYLINNDAASASAKNKKAHELNSPILTEEEFLKLMNG